MAAALLHGPPLLVLDEPTTGLDPNQVVEIRDLVRNLGRTRTVLLSTHVLSEVQAVCDRVVILHEGRVVADDATERITTAAAGAACVVALGPSKVRVQPEALERQLMAIDGVHHVHALAAGEDRFRYEVLADRDVRADLFRWAVERGHVLVELSERRRSLEQVFQQLTTSAAEATA